MTTSKQYRVNLHHAGSFLRMHTVTANSRKAAAEQVRAMYPANVIRKVVVL